ncbi:hypothetical protein P691DRAFT_729823 [Macrolepiota fuliginosa MF-IS2]|uniref:Cytochrome b561 domain-containing protein n=1 Tax=Macrolepiota fuliginosa MF-IS2 TaxID=1400762 RepID=A0A9P5XEJ3_9AGAR|nr:hypothetical protein P691DRAFT_729823 [Macrolepiota fuliginosa MF-IS2]
MDQSHMVMLWPNEDGTVTLSQRYGEEHHEPQVFPNPPRIATVVDPVVTSWQLPNSTRMAFKIPANKTALAENPVERLIWAYSMSRPEADPFADVLGHYRAGRIKVNFSKEAIPPPSFGEQPNGNIHQLPPPSDDSATFESTIVHTSPWGNHEKLITAHGILLAFGFLVLLPAGSLIARWTRTVTPKWFKAHSIVNMSIAMPIILIGWLLGPMAVAEHQAGHLITTHQICGVFILMLYLLQVWLGRYIHRRKAEGFVPVNRPHPPSNILHVCLGLSMMGFAFFQVRSGLDEWEYATGRGPLHAWCHDLWLAWTVIVPLAYIAGLALVPRQFYQERQRIMPGGINYIALNDGADSPLLFDRDREAAGIYEESAGEFRNTRLSMDQVKTTETEK